VPLAARRSVCAVRTTILCAFKEFVFCLLICEFSRISAALGFLRRFGAASVRTEPGLHLGQQQFY
jgi:hypothetical protein